MDYKSFHEETWRLVASKAGVTNSPPYISRTRDTYEAHRVLEEEIERMHPGSIGVEWDVGNVQLPSREYIRVPDSDVVLTNTTPVDYAIGPSMYFPPDNMFLHGGIVILDPYEKLLPQNKRIVSLHENIHKALELSHPMFSFSRIPSEDIVAAFEEKTVWNLTRLWEEIKPEDYRRHAIEVGGAPPNEVSDLLSDTAVPWIFAHKNPFPALDLYLRRVGTEHVYDLVKARYEKFRRSKPRFKARFIDGWKEYMPVYGIRQKD